MQIGRDTWAVQADQVLGVREHDGPLIAVSTTRDDPKKAYEQIQLMAAAPGMLRALLVVEGWVKNSVDADTPRRAIMLRAIGEAITRAGAGHAAV